MRVQAAIAAALLLAACSGEVPVGSTSGSGSSASGTSSGSSTAAGSTASSATSASSSSSSSSASGASSTGSGSSSASSSTSGSSSASASGSSSGSGGSSASSTSGSSGSSGETDAGPPDAGPFTYSTDPHTYWCHVFVDGGFSSFAQDDGGCIVTLPDCVGMATPLPLIATHVPEPQPVAYHEDPPNSGPHWFCWAAWGNLHAHVAMPAERFIHNSEHQGVILLYRCDPDAGLPDGGSCDAMAAPLIAFANGGGPADPMGCPTPRYIVTARPSMSTAYAAVAWGWTLTMDAWDAGTASCFAAAHLGAGPEPLCDEPDPNGCPQSYLP